MPTVSCPSRARRLAVFGRNAASSSTCRNLAHRVARACCALHPAMARSRRQPRAVVANPQRVRTVRRRAAAADGIVRARSRPVAGYLGAGKRVVLTALFRHASERRNFACRRREQPLSLVFKSHKNTRSSRSGFVRRLLAVAARPEGAPRTTPFPHGEGRAGHIATPRVRYTQLLGHRSRRPAVRGRSPSVVFARLEGGGHHPQVPLPWPRRGLPSVGRHRKRRRSTPCKPLTCHRPP